MKTIKRALSCFLALLMIFGSFSVISYAAFDDGSEKSVIVDTKFFVNGEEKTEVKAGDTVKVRVYLATDFTAASIALFYVYPLDFMEFEPTGLKSLGGNAYDAAGVFNTSETSITASKNFGGLFNHEEGVILDSESDADDLIYNGFLTEEYFDDKGWIALKIDSGTPVKHTIDNGNDDINDDHLAEFTFTVKEGASGEGYFHVVEESLRKPTAKRAFSFVMRALSDTSFTTHKDETAAKILYDFTLDDTNTIALEVPEAEKYAVTYEYTGDVPTGYDEPEAIEVEEGTAITYPEVTIPDGYKIEWSKVGDVDGKMGTAPVTVTGTWSKIEYDVTYSFTGEVPEDADDYKPADGKTTVGAKIEAPATDLVPGYALTWNVTGATKNADGSYTAGANNVSFVGTLAKNSYTITYYLSEQDKADGKVYDSQSFKYGEAVTAIDDPEVAGKMFDAWDIEIPESMPDKNLEAVAIFSDCIVTFYDIFGDELVDYTMVAPAEITEADLPSADDATAGEDVTFVEWQVDGAKLATPYAVESDVEVYPYCTVDVVYYSIYEGEDSENNVIHKEYTFAYGHEITEDDLADLGTPVRTGYSLDADMPWDNDLLYAMAESNTYAVANWIANEYEATFTAGDGAFAEGTVTTVNVKYDEPIEFKAEPVRAGYTFKGWTDVEGGTTALDKLVMDAEGKTFYPVFVMNGSADFLIELYLMNTAGTYNAKPDKTLYESGLIGVTAKADHDGCQQYVDDWFSADTSEEAGNVYSDVIAEDGSTVLKLYYKRAQYDVVIDGAAAFPVYHGAAITAPTTSANTPAGYEFVSWNDGAYTKGEVITVTKALTLTPDFTAGTSNYTINTYTMGLDGEYGAAESETKTYTTDETVTYTAPTVEGFKADKESYSVVVTGDGKAVINVYYARNQYDLVINGAEPVKVFHGAIITAPTEAANVPDGFHLASWNNGAVALGQEITVTGPVALTPDFEPNKDTAYTVEIYLQNADGSYPTDPSDTDKLTGTTGDTATAAHADYAQEAWYTPAEDGNVTSTTITADGNATLKLYYKRVAYKVTVDGVNKGEVLHGATFTAPSTSITTKAGYTLESWNDGTYAKGEVITVTSALDLVAKNVAAKSAYTVEIYLMNTDGSYPAAPSDTDELEGTTDTLATAAHAEYAQEAWYTPAADGNVTSATITGDGKAVLKLYFELAQYEVTIDGAEPVKVFHGATITAPTTTTATAPAGFKFAGWNDGAIAAGETITVTKALTLTPYFTEGEADYTVEIYLQNADGSYPATASDTEVETGKTGATVTIAHADYAQDAKYYLADDAQANELTGTIAGDGSLVLKLYFKRAMYTVAYEYEDGTAIGTATEVRYGDTITAPAYEKPEGMTFIGWFDKETGAKMPATMPANNVTYVVKFVTGDKVPYTVQINMMEVDGKTYLTTETQSLGIADTEVTINPDYNREGFTVNTEKSTLTQKVKEDGSTLYVVYYDRNLYTATFDGVDYQVYYGASLPNVEPAAQTGKKFIGWTPELPATMPAEKLEFTSNWEAIKYKLVYIINGTEEKYEYVAGEAITPIENPTVPGMKFISWNKEIPTVMPAEDVYIVAEFENATYEVNFLDAEGNLFEQILVEYGKAITLPETTPTKKFHEFKGWLDVPEKMPAGNITIYPDFEKVPVRLVAAEGSTTVIDRDTMIVTGLTDRMNDAKAKNYLAIEGDGYYELVPVAGYTGFYGTGAQILVYDNDDPSEPIEVFDIVIYGDVNGDSAVNSVDGSIVEDEVLFVTKWSRGTDKDALKIMAADLNKDGKIKQGDADSIVNFALGIVDIDQATGKVTRG